jgi:hypothetical protein
MFNTLVWLLLGSPLIITAMLMIRGAAKRRADLSLSRPQPRVEMPWNRNVDATRSGVDERYFSNSRNRDRASSFR